MPKKFSQNYSYANDSCGNLVNVSSARRGESYYCPICGEVMTPHMGKVRRWHFVHKNIGECSYESYLHMIAKIRIRDAFLSSEQFQLTYDAKARCLCDCPFIDFPECEGEKTVTHDLRRYYDACDMEAPYKKFRADLLLASTVNPKLPPVLIEIKVTHECTEDKIREGGRIIEIPIHSEEQIDYIVNNCRLEAVRYAPSAYKFSKEEEITLFNFDKEVAFNPIDSTNEYERNFGQCDTFVFMLDDQGQIRTFTGRCHEVKKNIPSHVHYFISKQGIPTYKEILKGFSNRGIRIRNCFLCKFSRRNDFWEDRICVLYKKYNLPRKPSPYSAILCPHYREDNLTADSMSYPECILTRESMGSSCIMRFYYYICEDIL